MRKVFHVFAGRRADCVNCTPL